jgi:ADP-ribose pyrophosphatase
MNSTIQRIADPKLAILAVQAQIERLRAQGLPEQWADVGTVFQDQIIRIQRDPVQFPSGALGTFINLERSTQQSGGVVIVPRLGDRFVMLRHWRYALGIISLEFPRGMVDVGESLEDGARREIGEEIGALCTSLKKIGCVQPDGGLMNMPAQIYLAEIDAIGELQLDEGIFGVETLTRSEIDRKLIEGEVIDGFSLSALAFLTASESETKP